MEIILDWRGPFLPKSFLDEKDPQPTPGVYLWLADFHGKKWVEYVGKASGSPTLGRRQQEHVSNTIGLKYTIPAQVRDADEDWKPGIYPENKNQLLIKSTRESLVDEALRYLDSMTFFLAPMEAKDRKLLGIVERNLLWALQPRSTVPGTKTPPPTPIDIKHRNASWASGSFENKFKMVPKVT